MRTYLRDEAAHALTLNATGGTPYRWQFRGGEDIVAGRVFGADDFRFEEAELRVVSTGAPFEIGLPLAHAVDLQRFPQMNVAAFSDADMQARVVVRQRLDSPEQTSAPIAIATDLKALDLSSLEWNPARPGLAAMLRLRFELPRGRTLHLRSVTLNPPVDARRIDLTGTAPAMTVTLPIDEDAIDQYARRAGIVHTPVLLLAPTARVEQRMLALRQIRAIAPSAIVIPEEMQTATFERARQQAGMEPVVENPAAWIAAGIFVVGLAFARLCAPRNARLRALLEITLVLAVPLWLIAGGRFTGHVDRLQAMLIAATAIYGGSLGIRRTWSWNGSTRAWLLASTIVLLAMAIGLFLRGNALREIGGAHVIRYLGWALLQQYLICALCVERWRIVTGSAKLAVYLSALCFSLLHTPNASLMLATFAGGLCWCALYLREHALLPLAASHAASALLLIALLPPDILLSAEVSARFFQ